MNTMTEEERKERNTNSKLKYRNSPRGRAQYLLCNYNRSDRKFNRGKGDLTINWLVDNIIFKPCAHCGKEGWDIIGCNRLDNSKPHTKDNVEPCCKECNLDSEGKEKSKYVYQYTLDGKLIKIWNSLRECQRNGYFTSNIAACCNGKIKHYKGYIWSFYPLMPY